MGCCSSQIRFRPRLFQSEGDVLSDKPLPEIVIDPLYEGKKSRRRGPSTKNKLKKKLNPIPQTTGTGNRPNKAIEIAHEIREIDIANEIYELMLSGKTEDEVMKELDVTRPIVRKYLDIKLQDVQDGLVALRGKFSVIGYTRLEQFVIAPAIAKIQQMQELGEFDSRAYETLMKGIKLQAELVAPKTAVNIANNSGDIFMSSGGDMYNEVVDMMRQDEAYDPPFTIEAEDVELSSFRIQDAEINP